MTAPNAVYVHPLAGGGNVSGAPVDLSAVNFSASDKRWVSARVNAIGIRVYPVG